MVRKAQRAHGVWIPAVILALAAVPARADYREGIAAFQKGNYAEAERIFLEEVESAPNYSYGWYMLGMIAIQQKKFADAETRIQKAIEIEPNKFTYYQGMAKVQYDQGNVEKAIQILEDHAGLVEGDRDRIALNATIGSYHAKVEDHRGAVEHLEKAMTNPPSLAVVSQLGMSYFKLNEFDKAIPHLKTAAGLAPGNQTVAFTLGSAYLGKAQVIEDEATEAKMYDEAVRQARQLLLADDKNAQYHNLLARGLFGAKRFGDALLHFQKVLEFDPAYCFAHTNIGKIHLAQNQLPAAEAALRKGIECDGSSHLTFETIGTVFEKMERFDDSLKAFQDARDRRPTAVSLAGVERLQAKITNRNLENEQARMEAEAKKKYDQDMAEYQKYQENLEKFYDKNGDKKGEEGDKDAEGEKKEGEEKEGEDKDGDG